MKKSKVILDFSAIKTGGGAQRAQNFFDRLLLSNQIDNLEITVIKTFGYFNELDKVSNIEVINNPKNFILRYFYEYMVVLPLIYRSKTEIVLTFTGSGLPNSSAFNIIGVNYPIICYDESPFWNYLSYSKKIKIKIKNFFRKQRIKNADLIFVQTETMKRRINTLFHKKNIQFEVIPPSPSSFIKEVNRTDEINIVSLNNNDTHKNLWRLFDVSIELYKLKVKHKFILTTSRSEYVKSLSKDFTLDEFNHILDSNFEFLGVVPSNKIQSVYDKANFVIQLSDLESFSNNYLEAWVAKLPLIASDRDFAKEICKNSAIYVNPHDPNEIAQSIVNLASDKDLQKYLISTGEELLKEFSNQDEYFNQILGLLNRKK